ncbi:MAG: pyruvate kinase [Gammaproteobacteria bacterium]|nr:pyruvate kinase [Gammaproteobacteria bacterium]
MINTHTEPSPLRWRRTKIIATLGPASQSEKKIEKLLQLGVNLFRINMSHGDHDQHRTMVKRIRLIARQLNRHVAVLMDLCGPKIRIGTLDNGAMMLEEGDSVVINCIKSQEPGVIHSQYQDLYKDVKSADRILLDDGKIELKVEKLVDKAVHCRVIYGGKLTDNKGMNLPDSAVSTSSFTSKDKIDAELAIELEADFLALSFVRNENDVQVLNHFLASRGADIPVIAKIEKPEAIDNIDAILEESYGIMVARGDLGIELPAQKVPLIQRDLINRARLVNKPVIVATQMLESMISSSRPTRAEVGDVANAALLGTDAVMLSAETASGKYPVKAVKMMDSVLREIEQYQWQQDSFVSIADERRQRDLSSVRKAVAHAVTTLARELNLLGIVIPTTSGTTAIILAADRPLAPLLAICGNERISRRLALHWGIVTLDSKLHVKSDWKDLCEIICDKFEYSHQGSSVLLVSGFNDDPLLNEPVMKIVRVNK